MSISILGIGNSLPADLDEQILCLLSWISIFRQSRYAPKWTLEVKPNMVRSCKYQNDGIIDICAACVKRDSSGDKMVIHLVHF